MKVTPEQKALAIEVVRRFNGSVTEEAVQIIRNELRMPNLSRMAVYRWWRDNRNQPSVGNTKSVIIDGILFPPPEGAPVSENDQATDPVPSNRLVPVETLNAAAEKLDDMFERVARRYLGHALKESTISDLKGRDAVFAAAIATDKMRLLRGLPTEIVQVIPQIVAAYEDIGIHPVDGFNALLKELDSARRANLT